VEKYSADAWWYRGNLLHWSRKYEDAINAYKNCDNEPANLWEIGECYVGLKKIEAGVAQWKEIENFFPKHAPRAAYHISQVYRRHGPKKKYEMALRNVLKKYPDSSQSRLAHVELEKLGVKMGGGIDAD
jgi:TolA-binding protein